MECKHLNQFSPSLFEWSISSCSADEKPYLPSICELDNYCVNSEHRKCPVFLKGPRSIDDTALIGSSVQ